MTTLHHPILYPWVLSQNWQIVLFTSFNVIVMTLNNILLCFDVACTYCLCHHKEGGIHQDCTPLPPFTHIPSDRGRFYFPR